MFRQPLCYYCVHLSTIKIRDFGVLSYKNAITRQNLEGLIIELTSGHCC